MPATQIQAVTCAADQPVTKSEVPTTPSSLSNLLEWLTELEKPAYSLDSQRITKDPKEHEATTRCRDTQGNAPDKGASVLTEFGAWHRAARTHFGTEHPPF